MTSDYRMINSNLLLISLEALTKKIIFSEPYDNQLGQRICEQQNELTNMKAEIAELQKVINLRWETRYNSGN